MKHPLYLSLAVLLFAACNKPIELPPPSAEKTISLDLSSGTIAAATIDSVEVFFSAPGKPPIRSLMQFTQSGWQMPAPPLAAGDYAINFRVYAREIQPGKTLRFQYAQAQVIGLPLTESKVFKGPNGTLEDRWLKRMFVQDTALKTTFIMGLHAEDPFFELQVGEGMRFQYVYIDKIAHWRQGGQSRRVESAAFEREEMLVSPGILNNRTAFAGLAERITGKDWNEGEILLLLMDEQGRDHTFYYSYSK
ncbi:MAG: hypothetical protein MUF29_01465 [Chitinophagaceae bacterium]|jgi:hypothetical protein|nr:hypothetical protein [Chitinophagaceae bacterium]